MNEPIKAFRVASFRVVGPLGEGGMGEVWRAVHEPTGMPAALKFLSNDRSTEADYIDAFRREAQSLAILRHPGIVRNFDYGVLRGATGSFAAGTPWVAMEFGDGGSLADSSVSDWPQTRQLLRELLAALAHAHARGMVHRDIKPENVLRTLAGRPRWLLSDFGLAHPVATSESHEQVFMPSAGTPAFIAPEQIMGRWRDWGPWTDLYALGCMTWLILTNQLPFSGSVMEMVWHHIEDEPPSMQPCFPVPIGAEAWIRRLMSKSPRGRFTCAMDALADLEALGDAEAPVSPLESHLPNAFATTRFDMRGQEWPTWIDVGARGVRFTAGRPPHNGRRRPFPELRQIEASDTPVAGVGLLGLRQPPLVGRTPHQEGLWNLARRALGEERPALAMIAGGRASGKTRLAEWVSREVNELGVGDELLVQHGEAAEDPWATALERRFLTHGLSRDEVRTRLGDLLENSGADVDGLTTLLRPGLAHRAGDASRFMSSTERLTVLRSVLQALARDRLLVVVLDDIHLSFDSLDLSLDLFEEINEPLLLVTTISTDDADQSAFAALDRAASSPRFARIDVASLTADETEKVVHSLVPMDNDSARRIAKRVAGRPGQAVQILEHLQDVWMSTFDGRRFSIPPEYLSRDLDEIWIARLEAVERGLHLNPSLLELAAILGRVFEQQLWQDAAAHSGLPGRPSQGDISDLVDAGILNRRGKLLSFPDGTLWDALHKRSATTGRRTELMLSVARYYAGGNTTESAIRASRILVVLQRYEEAIAVLERGDQESHRTEVMRRRRELVNLAMSIFERLESQRPLTPDERRKRLVFRLGEVLMNIHVGEAQRATEQARSAAEEARELEDPALEVEAETLTSMALSAISNEEASALALQRAGEAVQRVRDTRVVSLYLRQVGWRAFSVGQRGEAQTAFQRAGQLGGLEPRTQALAWRGLAQATEGAESEALAKRALAAFRACDDRVHQADVLSLLGDLSHGQFEQAREYYLEAVELFDRLGHFARHIARVNMAGLLLRNDRSEEARSIYEIVELAVREDSPFFRAVARSGMLIAATVSHDGDTWDAEFEEVLADFVIPDNESARMASLAVDAWSEVGDTSRADQARQLVDALRPSITPSMPPG